MEYIINVAKPCNGRYVHYFRVEVQYGRVRQVYEELVEKFPDCEIEVTCWEKTGRSIDMNKCDF